VIGFRVTGLEGVEQALRELKKSTAKNVVRRVLTRALEPVAAEARRLAPYKRGRLRISIVTGTRLTGRARRARRPETRTGTTVYVGSASRNAVPREFGTWRTPAQPFLRPAWESQKGRVLNYILDNLKAEIDLAIRRAASRSGSRR
jgi:HK97 gp10 family phage protein